MTGNKIQLETGKLAYHARRLPLDLSEDFAFCASMILYFSAYEMSRDPSAFTRRPIGIVSAMALMNKSSERGACRASPVRVSILNGENRCDFCLSLIMSRSLVRRSRENRDL